MAEKEKVDVILREIVRRLNEHLRRIRILEDKVEKIENDEITLSKEFLEKIDETNIKLGRILDKINELKERMNEFEKEINEMKKKINTFVTKEELAGIESYVSIFNPLKSKFVTREEVLRMISSFRKRKKVKV